MSVTFNRLFQLKQMTKSIKENDKIHVKHTLNRLISSSSFLVNEVFMIQQGCHIRVHSKFPDISMTFPWQNKFSLTISSIFQSVKKQLLTLIISDSPMGHTPGFLIITSNNQTSSLYLPSRHLHKHNPGRALTMWWKFQSKNNVMTKFPDNSLTCLHKIPWQFPDMGQMTKIPWHFFKIPWLFPDLEKILFFPDISLTRGNPVQMELNLNITACNTFFKLNWMNLYLCCARAANYPKQNDTS